MPKRTAVQKRAREIQQAEGVGYHDALNRARAEAAEPATTEAPAPAPAAVAYVLEPTAAEAELGITAEELGVRALPADAGPARRARAEAAWRAVDDPARPCRCSGTRCEHGGVCATGDDDGLDPCKGRLVHVDRHPGSLWGLTTWWDVYECSGCFETLAGEVELPDVPWGEQHPRDGVVVYDGVRHPAFSGLDADEDEVELDPDVYPTPEDDYREYDEHQDHEEPLAEQDEGYEPDPDYPKDNVDSYEDPPEDYYEGELKQHPWARGLDVDSQPTAVVWSPLDSAPPAAW